MMKSWIDSLYVTTGQAARESGYCIQGIINLAERGVLAYDMSPLGRLIKRDSLDAFIAKHGRKERGPKRKAKQ